jgi:hypothetical protein
MGMSLEWYSFLHPPTCQGRQIHHFGNSANLKIMVKTNKLCAYIYMTKTKKWI